MQLPDFIPAARHAAVADALNAAFKSVPVTVSPLQGGLSTATVYRVEADGKAYVLKLDAPGTNYECQLAAASAGVAPAVRYASEAHGICISEFITGQPLRGAFADPAEMIKALAQTIRRMHNMPPFAKQGSMQTFVDQLIAAFRQAPTLPGAQYETAFSLYTKIPWKNQELVASHNDLNPSNVLFDGTQVHIIDWDAAFTNDRYADLAIAANSFARTPELEAVLLNTYFDAPGEYEKARLFLMRQTCYIVYALLMFQLSARSIPALLAEYPQLQETRMRNIGEMAQAGQLDLGSAKGQLFYGHALLNEALHGMQSPRFEEALQIVN
jgi:thiamine kinase-like enzyme